MSKKQDWIVCGIIFVQSIVINIIYLYSQINKWNLIEEMTVFIYPFYKILIIVLTVFSFLVSVIYFFKKFLKERKYYVCIPVFISVVAFITVHIFFCETKLREYNFYKYREKREEIVRQILHGELAPNDRGIIELPEELQDEEMAREGYVYVVNYLANEGIYFCTFSGLLETSSGYMYLTDESNIVNSSSEEIVVLEKYEERWYYCSTN